MRKGSCCSGWWRLLLPLSSWLLACSCSFLIDVGDAQCDSDGDCTRAGIGMRCDEGLCVAGDGPGDDGPGDRGDDSDAGIGDAGMDRDAQAPGERCGSLRCEPGQACLHDRCVSQSDAQRWQCDPAPEPDQSAVVRYRVHVMEAVSELPPSNLHVRACLPGDIECAQPVAHHDVLDDSGDVELELPAGFTGFFELEADDTLRTLFSFTRPLAEDFTRRELRVLSPATLALVASVDGLEVDDSRGLVILEAIDCSGEPAGGIHFVDSKDSGVPFYLVNGLPNADATTTVLDELRNVAVGGFFNTAVGFTHFGA